MRSTTRCIICLALVVAMMACVLIPAVSSAPASKSVYLTATALGPRPDIAIELSATEIDFGDLYNGETSSPQALTVSNIGLKPIDVTVTASDEGDEPLFVPGLLVDNASWRDYSTTLAVNGSEDTQLTLHMPDNYPSLGEVSGCATFWAEEHTGSQDSAADFTSDVISGQAPLTVHFTDASTNSPTSWSWDFDSDGTEDSTEQNPSFTYTADGTYTVKLTATNSTGSDEEIKSGYIVVSSKVDAQMDWVTFQGDNFHTGVTTEQAAVSQPSLSWSAQATTTGMAGFDIAPIVADGTVFMIGQNGAVLAYGVDSGNVLWQRTDLVINKGMGFQLSTPAYHDGMLYVALIMGTKQGFGVFALDADDGHTAWSARFLEGWNVQPNTPISYDEGKLFLGCWFSNSTAGHYYCLNAADGSIEWDRVASSAKSYYGAGAAIIGDYLVFGEDSGNVISVNKHTGETVQELSAASTFGVSSSVIRASVTYSISTRMVFFTMQTGKCCAIGFDATTGTFDTSQKWVATIGTYSTSTPAVYDGKVYVGSGTFSAGENYLFCLDEATGAIQWQLSANGGVASSPVISTHNDDGDGEVYIYFTTNAAAGRVYCVDADGNEKWYYEAPTGQGNYILHGVAIYDGKVFFGNDSGYIFAVGGA